MNKKVFYWLLSICLLVISMVTVGGITRLTGSGLSITEWAPILGAIPPLNEEDWIKHFSLYQTTPQYIKINYAMTLHEFKWIFFWEYLHRLIARLIGIVVLIPAIYFYVSKQISPKLFKRVLIGFGLGGLQGLMGWIMVMSGLVDLPSVSHFRLAAHLLLALTILSYFTFTTMSYASGFYEFKNTTPSTHKMSPLFKGIVLLFILQLTYGAFTAGLKAGLGFNTFPLMDGGLIAGNAFNMEPAWINYFENSSLIQFIHRSIGWILLLLSGHLFAKNLKPSFSFVPSEKNAPLVKRKSVQFAMGIWVQFILGVATLLSMVSIPLAVLHQFWGAILVVLLTRYYFVEKYQ